MKIASAIQGSLISERATVIVDLEAGLRGGSVYMARLSSWLESCGASVSLRQICLSRSRDLWGLMLLLFQNWTGQIVLRGTLPAFLPIALLSRSSMLYLGTPVDRWSRKSRLLFRLASLKPGLALVAASVYARKTAFEGSFFRQGYVSYAKINLPLVLDLPRIDSFKSVAFAILSPGDQSKGFECCLSLLAEVSCCFNVFIDIYGKSSDEFNVSDYARYGNVFVHGFVEDPFGHFSRLRKGLPGFYLALSAYEGLHMAVVDAACYGIPSLLSDIPAHRELELIAGLPLLIAGKSKSLMSLFLDVARSEGDFDGARAAALRLALQFQDKALCSEALEDEFSPKGRASDQSKK